MTIRTKLKIDGTEYKDYQVLQVTRSIGDFNSSSEFIAVLDSPYGRHKTDFTVGKEVKVFADNQTFNFISHYRLNDNLATTNVIDTGTGGNDGTLNGGDNTSDKSVTGKINLAFQLNGSDDFINIDNVLTNDLSTTTKGTWAIWVKPVDATPSAIDITISFNDTDANTFIHIRIKTDGVCRVKATSTGTSQWQLDTDNAVFSDNTWTHVAIVQDGTEPVLYIDGVKVAQTFSTSEDKTVWFNNLSGLDNGRIGDRSVNGGGETNHFNGDIDDVRIYDTNLSSSDISDIYNSGDGTEEDQLIFTGILEKIKFREINVESKF
ncbi:MAG: LamG domain-containing protein [Bacteroidetes bacterium]|nr:LamG domain-containing protein [Bacteroidota bacterium]